jgi:hypothetical protein
LAAEKYIPTCAKDSYVLGQYDSYNNIIKYDLVCNSLKFCNNYYCKTGGYYQSGYNYRYCSCNGEKPSGCHIEVSRSSQGKLGYNCVEACPYTYQKCTGSVVKLSPTVAKFQCGCAAVASQK